MAYKNGGNDEVILRDMIKGCSWLVFHVVEILIETMIDQLIEDEVCNL